MKTVVVILASILLAAPGAAPVVGVRDLLTDAEKAMTAERYPQALELLEKARKQLPDAPQIPFNMGVAAFRNGDLARAQELFDAARLMARDPALRAKSAYNLGTTSFEKSLQGAQDPQLATNGLEDAQRDLEAALQQFRDAIEADPQDNDARVNGELAYRWLKELQELQEQMQQQQQQQGQEQQDDQEQSDDPNPTDQPRDESTPQPGEDNDQTSPQPGEQEDESQDAQQGRPEPEQDDQQQAGPRPMTREEARRLLQGVRDKERLRREELARQEASGKPPVDKNW